MSNIDAEMLEKLREARTRAEAAGYGDLAEYLALRTRNDELRAAGVGWLLDNLIARASNATKDIFNASIVRDEPHSFARGSSTMVGWRVIVRYGVRCLTVEAGWARSPEHGFMAKGALAYGRVTHFGKPEATKEIRLAMLENVPVWLGENGQLFDVDDIDRQVSLLLDDQNIVTG